MFYSLPEDIESSLPVDSVRFSFFFRRFPKLAGGHSFPELQKSMDWFKGKSTGKPWFLPSNIGVSCKFSHYPIL